MTGMIEMIATTGMITENSKSIIQQQAPAEASGLCILIRSSLKKCFHLPLNAAMISPIRAT
jgi:hypothetical protein